MSPIRNSTVEHGSGGSQSSSAMRHEQKQPTQDLFEYMKEYARQNPEVAAMWCFGIGFVLGWKLKPW